MAILFGLFRRRTDRAAALDALHAHVMMADNRLTITYMNTSLKEMLREAEPEIQKVLPHFRVDRLIGSNVDVFHKNPSHQRNLLEKLTAPHNALIHVGNRVFDLAVVPMMRGGERLGFTVEWADASHSVDNAEMIETMKAVSRAQAMVEFTPDGSISTERSPRCATPWRL